MRERERETKKSDHVPMIVLKHVSNVTLHLELCFCDFWLVAKLTQKYFQRSLGCDFQRLGFVLSIFVMMYDMTIESELMMIVDGCGSNDGCENYKRKKCIDSTDHEKTSYAAILGGKDVIGDDIMTWTIVVILIMLCFFSL